MYSIDLQILTVKGGSELNTTRFKSEVQTKPFD